MRSTSFNPATHGFRFENRFSNNRFPVGLIHLNFGGRCGGMVFTALDFYFANPSVQIPTISRLPVEGSALSTYISVRQDAATWGQVDRWVELVLGQPGRSAEFFGWGMQETGGGYASILKAEIDGNRPAPLGLVGANDLLRNHHQVLAIGYDGTGEDLRITVYDPNYPGVTKVLRPYPDTQTWGYEGTNAGAGEGPDQARWRTYFVDRNYRHRQPAFHLVEPGADYEGRNFRGNDLNRRAFQGVNANGADFTGSAVTYTDFEGANLNVAKFHGANARHSNFLHASLYRTDFYGADLKNATLAGVNAKGANFHGADLRLVNEQVHDDEMVGTFFNGAEFYGANLHRSKLAFAHAIGANFYGADLGHADLRKVDFSGANLEGADLRHADLRDARFTGARIVGTDFRAANLAGAIDYPDPI